MKRIVVVLIGAAFGIGALASFYQLNLASVDSEPNFLVGLGVPVGLLLICIVLVLWATDDNIYNVKSGVVVDHKFVAAHTVREIVVPGSYGVSYDTPTLYIPSQDVPDDWAIQIRDEQGHTGWKHFEANVFDLYPKGSYYDGNNPKQRPSVVH